MNGAAKLIRGDWSRRADLSCAGNQNLAGDWSRRNAKVLARSAIDVPRSEFAAIGVVRAAIKGLKVIAAPGVGGCDRISARAGPYIDRRGL